jgi:dienelactone hydrolase
MRLSWIAIPALSLCVPAAALGQPARVIDIPTRQGITARFLYVAPEKPKAAAVLFPGGQGDFQVDKDANIVRQQGNFLVRTRDLFAEKGIAVAVVAPPSDRTNIDVFFRETHEHAEDIRALIAWLRREAGVPVWLVGTSRGTLSAGYIATQLSRDEGGADGIVLTSSILSGGVGSRRTRDPTVIELALERIAVPVLVVHHKQDRCRSCPVGQVPWLMDKLTAAPRKEFIPVEGGADEGDSCGPLAHHGYNGIERDVVEKIAGWMLR